MEEILNNLVKHETLYITRLKTNYHFIRRSDDGGIKYSIKQNSKTLPLATINTAYQDFQNGVEINSNWYKNYNYAEYKNRSCNLSILRSLLNRLN